MTEDMSTRPRPRLRAARLTLGRWCGLQAVRRMAVAPEPTGASAEGSSPAPLLCDVLSYFGYPAGLRRFRTMPEQLASPLSGVLRGRLLTEAACCDGDWWCQWWCQCKGQVCRPRHRWMTHLIRNEKSSQASRHRGPTTCGVQARSQMTCDISEAPMRAADESCEYRGRLRPPSSDGGTTVSHSPGAFRGAGVI